MNAFNWRIEVISGTFYDFSDIILFTSFDNLAIPRYHKIQKHFQNVIDNHDSGYLGMAVQLYVQAHLRHYHILTQKVAQMKSMPLFTYICIIELLKTCRKHNTTTCIFCSD